MIEVFSVSAERRTLVATFGFDIDFVLRRLASGRFNRVVLLALYTSEEAYRRVEKAYHTLSIVCKSMNTVCELEKLEPAKIFRSVLSILRKAVEESESIEVYLTGGPRLLVTAVVALTLSLPKHLVDKVDVVVEGEGFECEARINASKLVEALKLGERDLKVLLELQARGPSRISELTEYTEIPRSTLYRKLEDLQVKGLVKKEGDQYVAEEVYSVTCR